MKKNVWLLGVAVAALTSCTQSEVVDIPESRVIGFDTHVDKSTRAVDDIGDLSADFKELYVFGDKGTFTNSVFNPDDNTPYMNHVKVAGGKGNWTYNPHLSWVEGKTFRFAAYANGKGDGSSNAAKLTPYSEPTPAANTATVKFVKHEAKTVDETTISTWGLDIDNYTVEDRDLLVAIPHEVPITTLSSAPGSVGLTFKHVLAKVIFEFRYVANAADQNMVLEIVPFNVNAYHSGNCKLRYTGVADNSTIGADWTTTGTASPYVFFPQVDDKNQTWKSGNLQSAYYVIPQSNENLKVDNIIIKSIKKINGVESVTRTDNFTNVSLKISGHTEWLPGYVYRYMADITPGEHYIHFTTSVNSWVDEDNRNQTIGGGNAQQAGNNP